MRRMKLTFMGFVGMVSILCGSWLHSQSAYATASANLISNPSMETATTTTTPSGWSFDRWGTNTATPTYLTTGHTGSRSLQIQMTSYTGGDAKWFATPVSVTPGTVYTYSDYYKASVTTRLIVQYTASSGAVSYVELPTSPAASPWTQVVRTFTPPTGTAKATMLHLISAVGTLTIDDASLTYDIPDVSPPPATDGNLVPNSSLETATGSPATPVSWATDRWGTNTTSFTYATSGHSGSRSVQLVVSGYINGDAKWYFQPVAIKPNTSYDFSDYYQASAPTRTVMVTYDVNNTPTYTDITTVVPAYTAGWALTKKTIMTPANAVKMTIYHLIEANGMLQIDDMSIIPTPPPVAGANPISNPSVELEATLTTPADWIANSWGNNTASLQYIKNDGHNSTKSVKVTVSNYVDGDAKWYPQPFALAQNKQYRFTTWYKTNAHPQATVMFTKADGTFYFATMPQPFPSSTAATTWQKYSDTFTVPADAVGVSPFLFLPANGFLQVDDESVEAYTPMGFTRPLMTLTFDDGEEDNATTALPLLKSHNIKATQCFATQYVEGIPSAQSGVLAFRDAGHEICSHSVTHPFLTQVGASQLTTELTHSQQYLQTLTGQPITSFASPYGDYNQAVNTEIAKYYRSHRTVDEGYNSKDNFNAYRVRVQNMFSNTPIAQYKGWIAQAQATNTWLVLVYHRIAPSGATDVGTYDTPVANFGPQLDAITASGIVTKTYNAALDELMPQLP